MMPPRAYRGVSGTRAMVDVNAIGAGGGSIAWLDGAGGLRVGPHSAGSDRDLRAMAAAARKQR